VTSTMEADQCHAMISAVSLDHHPIAAMSGVNIHRPDAATLCANFHQADAVM
jgi:hypothetical protein